MFVYLVSVYAYPVELLWTELTSLAFLAIIELGRLELGKLTLLETLNAQHTHIHMHNILTNSTMQCSFLFIYFDNAVDKGNRLRRNRLLV